MFKVKLILNVHGKTLFVLTMELPFVPVVNMTIGIDGNVYCIDSEPSGSGPHWCTKSQTFECNVRLVSCHKATSIEELQVVLLVAGWRHKVE